MPLIAEFPTLRQHCLEISNFEEDTFGVMYR